MKLFWKKFLNKVRIGSKRVVKILVVDDEKEYGRIIKESCGKSYEVKVESRPDHALEAARKFKPDLILLDIVMPVSSGVDIARRIQADPDLRRIPFAFMTASLGKSTLEHAGGKIEGRPCLIKPFSIRALDTFLEHALAA